ncbi:MAG: lysophospholipid acyltransferase family protein [Aquisalimonadaceae bacterium]
MRLWRRFCSGVLRAAGWRIRVPDALPARCVVVVAPHTSNWDFFVGYPAKVALGLDLRFMAKHSLFRGPCGWWLRRAGGLPVDRRNAQGLIGQSVESFARRERFMLVITPEGTRGRTDYWKSGFYHIAREAGVPILLAYLDYGRREVGIGLQVMPSGDVGADMAGIRAFYDDKQGRIPANQGPVMLRLGAGAPRDT